MIKYIIIRSKVKKEIISSFYKFTNFKKESSNSSQWQGVWDPVELSVVKDLHNKEGQLPILIKEKYEVLVIEEEQENNINTLNDTVISKRDNNEEIIINNKEEKR